MEIDPREAREERAQLVLDKAGWLEAGDWDKEEKDGSNVSKGKFARLPAPLVEKRRYSCDAGGTEGRVQG
jgi:hypothetical protein